MKKGFTLVEIMIVVAIIALLAVIAIPSFMRARLRSQQSACINNLRIIDSAKEQYGMEYGLTNLAEIGTNDTEGFTILVGPSAYIKHYPLCPASTTIEVTADNAAVDYTISVMGTNPLCNKVPGGDFSHALPAP